MAKKTLTALIALLFCTVMFAQVGYKVNKIFEGSLLPKDKVSEVTVRGSELKSFKLNKYHSISCTGDLSLVRQVADVVLEDAEYALDLEKEYNGSVLTYLLMKMPGIQAKKYNSYICYKATKLDTGDYRFIVVYLSGEATLDELKSSFGGR